MRKNKPVLILLALCISIVCCTSNSSDKPKGKKYTVYVSPFKPLLYSNDHTSEGFLAPLDDGKILLIFRFDPGVEGNHVGIDGYIAQITYDPETDKWGEVKTVYNSHQYDDRNIHGGVTKEGRIVTFFRRYDGGETEGRYFIYSDDKGETWSEPRTNNFFSDPQVIDMRGNMSTGQMFYNPDIDKYTMLGFLYSWDQNKNYITRRRYTAFSQDGSSWEEYSFVEDKQDYRLNEIAGAWCGDNRIIALQRDDERKHGHPLMQVESHDNGQTWTEPVPTNIPPGQHWGAAPQLIYDRKRNLLIALNSDRYSRPDEQNSIFIYTAHPADVTGNPSGWTLQHELKRPWSSLGFNDERPLNQNLYGYCTIAVINKDEYLVVFTERARMQGTEQADLYYFKLIIN